MPTVHDALKVLNANPKYDYSYALKSGKGLGDLLAPRALTGEGRGFVITKIKDPLRKVLVLVMKRLVMREGTVTKEKTTLRNTHSLLDIRERFFSHYINSSRMDLMQAAWELFPFEHEHDSHYRWLFYWLLKELIKEIEAGKFILPDEPFPDAGCWKE